jgi:hypothetical protein
VRRSDESSWRKLFALESAEEVDNGQEALSDLGCRVVTPSLSHASQMRSKDKLRLFRYLKRKQIPSLPDALRAAASDDRQSILVLLLQAGADPNAIADSGAHGVGFTQVGAYPLHLAAKRSHLATLEILASWGAEVDAKDQNGRTALMIASASGRGDSVEWLLEKKACVDVVSDYGANSLHTAALLPRVDILELLLKVKAAPDVPDRDGLTALHIVCNSVQYRAEKRREEMSCDPSGFGDEYCYCRNASHGYSHNTQELDHDVTVKAAAQALLQYSAASMHIEDDRGRTPSGILQSKNRLDLRDWLDSEGAKWHEKQTKQTTTPEVSDVALPSSSTTCFSGCFSQFGRRFSTSHDIKP